MLMLEIGGVFCFGNGWIVNMTSVLENCYNWGIKHLTGA
jgi:hypothetical protein